MSTTLAPQDLLTKENAPSGTICLVKDTLYVVDAFNIARKVKQYVPGDHYDQKGVPGFPKMPARDRHTGSKFFHSYRKTVHGGVKWVAPETADAPQNT